MNESNNPTNPGHGPEQESNEKETGQTQVPLRKKVSQQIKDGLNQLKHDQVPVYSYGNFLAHVIEKHWSAEMEKLQKKSEKIKKMKE